MKKLRRFLSLALAFLVVGCPLVVAAETPIPISSIEELQSIGNEPDYPLYGRMC